MWKIVEGTIHGLSYLYSKGIEHSSLKLSNIYLTPKG